MEAARMDEPSEELRKGIVKLDRDLDAIFDRHLRGKQKRMREDGIAERDVRAFTRDRREQFELVKQYALTEAISFITGTPFADRTTTLQ
jgi:hypothetical protein